MEKLIDMHSHTCYSDGDLTPDELVRRAKSKGVTTMAITDHDTLLGVQNLDLSGLFSTTNDVDVINGIELTAKVSKGRMHILGYDIDIFDKNLNTKMEELQNNSVYSVISYINQLKIDYGITFSTDDIREILNAKRNIGRPDLARLCVKYGYASDVNDAFIKYLIDVYQKVRKDNKGLTYGECIKLINDAGGVAVLAHPHSLGLSNYALTKLLIEMMDSGLKGIEVYHSNHTEEQTNIYYNIAQNFGLLVSGGSDFHGESVKPDIEIGSGRNNNIHIKELSLLKHIKR